VDPVEDAHQGGLARAVFPQQGVDLPGPDLQGHAIVGDDSRKCLSDVSEGEEGLHRHRVLSAVAFLPANVKRVRLQEGGKAAVEGLQ
jgi:hypothetical protein